MTTARRLSDSEVKAIFHCLHYNSHPPPHLTFHVLQVGVDCEKQSPAPLSPPPYEFEDGLYVLTQLKTTKIPEHLKKYVMKDLPTGRCHWSLSGPQFPKNQTAIQQRYCYPTGRPEYCDKRGSSVWTMYRTDREEDKMFRLFHVYYSPKRETNRRNRAKKKGAVRRPAAFSPGQRKKRTKRVVDGRRLATATETATPLVPPEVVPSPLVVSQKEEPDSQQRPSKQVTPQGASAYTAPFGDFFPLANSPHQSIDHDELLPRNLFSDPYPCDWDAPFAELDETSHWNEDTVMPLLPKPSEDESSLSSTPRSSVLSSEQCIQNFCIQLDHLQETVRDTIFSAPATEQGALLSIFAQWGKQIASKPLEKTSEAVVQKAAV